MLPRLLLVPVVIAVLTAPAAGGVIDTPLCKRNLTSAYASLGELGAKVMRIGADKDADACVAYRKYFIEIVRARAVTAQCKTGSERDEDLGRFDVAAEQANAGIADRCG